MDKILTTFLQVNLKVGKSLASAIEKGEQAADATKQAVGTCIHSQVPLHRLTVVILRWL